nr:putative GEM-like protein 8 [Ipomoea batatas]
MNPPVQSYARTGKSHVDVGIPISTAICSFHNSQRTILHDGEGRRQVLTLSKQTSKIRSITFGHKINRNYKGKALLGAKILQVGGVGKIFKRNFDVKDGEKLVKTSQCYLSTTAGPIAGLLFISTDKVAFCSERSIKILSANGKSYIIRCYKVTIPLRKIKSANESHNVKKPSQKYVQVVTEDKFEFWFMGFINHKRTLRFLQEAIISQNQCQHMLSQTGGGRIL